MDIFSRGNCKTALPEKIDDFDGQSSFAIPSLIKNLIHGRFQGKETSLPENLKSEMMDILVAVESYENFNLMTEKEITSLQHPLVKHLVKLRQDRNYRYASKRVLLSGRKLIKEISATTRLRTLLLKHGSIPSIEADEIIYATPEILKKVTGLENPEPIAAEIAMPDASDLSSANFLLILDRISDPGNLGTLLRSARALGWDGAFLTPGSTDPYNEKTLRAAKGATFTLPWRCGTWEELSTLLKNKAFTILAADASGKTLSKCSFSSPLALILGNESHGIEPEIKNGVQSIAIPMMGRMESLNVASAGAILMHDLKERSHE